MFRGFRLVSMQGYQTHVMFRGYKWDYVSIQGCQTHLIFRMYRWVSMQVYQTHLVFGWFWFDFLCLMLLSAIFQLYLGDQFYCWQKPECLERTTDHGQATGNFYHLRLRVECTLFSSPGHRPCELLSWVSVRRPSVR